MKGASSSDYSIINVVLFKGESSSCLQHFAWGSPAARSMSWCSFLCAFVCVVFLSSVGFWNAWIWSVLRIFSWVRVNAVGLYPSCPKIFGREPFCVCGCWSHECLFGLGWLRDYICKNSSIFWWNFSTSSFSFSAVPHSMPSNRKP